MEVVLKKSNREIINFYTTINSKHSNTTMNNQLTHPLFLAKNQFLEFICNMNLRTYLYAILFVIFAGRFVHGAEPSAIRVLVWDEQQREQRQAYGDQFLGEAIASHLASLPGIVVKTATLTSPDHGLSDAVLDATDVVVWWSHQKNKNVPDKTVERVVSRVQQGRLALVSLHSAHWSKPFVRLMQERAKSDALLQIPEAERATARIEYLNDQPYGKVPKADAPLTPALTRTDTGWSLVLPGCIFPAYRPDGAPGHLTTLLVDHPIAKDLPKQWDIPQTEMYNEPFHVPTPDTVVFEERWDKGEHFRSGCVWKVGKGTVFYFRPGHETYPVFKQREPLRVIENAARWLGGEVRKNAP